MAGCPLRVGESIIPLFISVNRKRSAGTGEPDRPLRWIDTRADPIQTRFRDLAYFIAQNAAYDTATTVPSRAKGKQPMRTLREGYKPLQVLVQPECGLYRPNGSFVTNEDALCFYDMDSLPITRLIEAHERLRGLMEQGRAFVWMNTVLSPKAAFWVRLTGETKTHQAMLTRIHEEVFQGDPECAPALGASDMWKSFVHSAEVLEGMRVFFEEAYRRHVQAIYQAAREREKVWHEQRVSELTAATAKEKNPDPSLEDPGKPGPDEMPVPVKETTESKKSGIENYLGVRDPNDPLKDEFDAYMDREFPSRLDHNLKLPLYEEPLPKSLFGRKASRLQELVLRLALSMPGRLLGEGVGIPSTLVQKLAHQFFPEAFELGFDESGNMDASGASKAIGQLVRRGILEVTDHSFRPGGHSKRYRAVHPDLIALAQERANPATGNRFSKRTVDDVDRRWQELTGQSLSDTTVDGIRDQVIYRLTNFCPTYEVFEEAALRIPGMRQGKDRQRFLPTQWQAHVERDKRRPQTGGDVET